MIQAVRRIKHQPESDELRQMLCLPKMLLVQVIYGNEIKEYTMKAVMFALRCGCVGFGLALRVSEDDISVFKCEAGASSEVA